MGVSEVDLDLATALLSEAAASGVRGWVCVTGAHGIVESQSDSELRKIHNDALLTVPDGMPLVRLMHRLGAPGAGRVYGPDLMRAIFGRAPGIPGEPAVRHALVGGTQATLGRLSTRLRAMYPAARIVHEMSPPFRPMTEAEAGDLVRALREARPDFVWVGLGTPKQERFMASLAGRLDRGILIGVGAAFDVLAGVRADAPDWMKRAGLQWLHRLLQEPARLGPRYAHIVPAFLRIARRERKARARGAGT